MIFGSLAEARSLADIDLSTTANDLRAPASFSSRKDHRCIPANTPPVYPGLRPRIWLSLLRLVMKAMSDRLPAIGMDLVDIALHDCHTVKEK